MPQIFVVGAPRSGTSIVRQALNLVVPANTFNEGHLMGFMAEMWSKAEQQFLDLPARQFKGMLVAQVDPSSLKRRFVKFVRELFVTANGSTDILDKTPGIHAVAAVPFTLEVFPQAKIVFCHRRAIENVSSRLRKWPETPFKSHCNSWATIMKTWRNLRLDLQEDCFIEVEQLDIALHPDRTALLLGTWLNQGDTRISAMRNIFSKGRTEIIRGSSPTQVFDFEQLDWTHQQKQDFLTICASEMQEWNYTLDASYSIHYQNGQGI